LGTAEALTLLSWARLLIAFARFDRWRATLGLDGPVRIADARYCAALVEWAATRQPIEFKCLPRAMALSWMLRRRRLGHTVVIAVRPAGERGSRDDLHAWVEVGVRAASRVEELGMKNDSIKPKAWTRPELKRLGRIEDVAGSQTPLTQAANTKS